MNNERYYRVYEVTAVCHDGVWRITKRRLVRGLFAPSPEDACKYAGHRVNNEAPREASAQAPAGEATVVYYEAQEIGGAAE